MSSRELGDASAAKITEPPTTTLAQRLPACSDPGYVLQASQRGLHTQTNVTVLTMHLKGVVIGSRIRHKLRAMSHAFASALSHLSQ